jgi:hypothetical protein
MHHPRRTHGYHRISQCCRHFVVRSEGLDPDSVYMSGHWGMQRPPYQRRDLHHHHMAGQVRRRPQLPFQGRLKEVVWDLQDEGWIHRVVRADHLLLPLQSPLVCELFDDRCTERASGMRERGDFSASVSGTPKGNQRGTVTIAADVGYDMRSRMRLNQSQISGKCLRVRMHGYGIPSSG